MRFAIFLREGDRTYDKVNVVPGQFRNRILAVRSFDAKAMMVANQLVDCNEIEPVLEKMLARKHALSPRISMKAGRGGKPAVVATAQHSNKNYRLAAAGMRRICSLQVSRG